MLMKIAALTGMFAASVATGSVPSNGGPYDATFLVGGIGIGRTLDPGDPVVAAGAPYSMTAWVRPDALQEGSAALIVLGGANAVRALSLDRGRLVVRVGGAVVTGPRITPARWTHVAAVSDGSHLTLYVDGRPVARGSGSATAVEPRIAIAPALPDRPHFGGKLTLAKVESGALDPMAIAALAHAPPDFDLVHFWEVGVGWPLQRQANIGLTEPQDPWTLPRSRGDAAYRAPVVKPVPVVPALQPTSRDHWQINGWRLAAAPDVPGDGAALSRPGVPLGPAWRVATVPGTVLQTLVDRGVYPDPYYGLNNLRIPERLARQDYWYRTTFAIPAAAAGKRLTLVFGGINYAAEVWVNGQTLGTTRGAFIRGQFDFVPSAGQNVIAVRVSPPPHPGIPHEQSVKGGVGENGGQLAVDGPTFVATEGWDWIPGIRDRDTGIWRPVSLVAHGAIRILDPHVVTDLPLPRTDHADVRLTVPLLNTGPAGVVTVRASFEGVAVEKTVRVPQGRSEVAFIPTEFPELRLSHPRLWWPNGYGAPNLYVIDYSVSDTAGMSDSVRGRFGVREVSYDLSLFDHQGMVRRVTVQPTDGTIAGTPLIDVRHQAIKQSPAGWVESLTTAGETSPAVTPADTHLPEPHLVIRVNGVPIAARGGSWGMDDAMKRVSYASLAPYFRLEREAHMNVVRNWMGNNTEDEFYDLADENGIMVLNDFWQSTQNFQVEPDDPQLFLQNARDVIARYRNHPSIILWFGRNEGVPYPTLNEGLDRAVFELDGTRWYTGSSNTVNLQGSGPYNYRSPVGYHTNLATGFSVETGTPSLASAESIAAYVPPVDRWPIGDVLAYHDWHFAGNGDTKTFVAAMDAMFGPATSFEDFERKAQMMQLEAHQAMMEGFLGHLWTRNSGRLFWMTHPSWPSNTWQLYASDYDAHASYYGAKRGAEPLHIQLNLPGNDLTVINTTQDDEPGLTTRVTISALDGRVLWTGNGQVDAAANRATVLAPVPLDRLSNSDPMLLVSLALLKRDRVLATNFYWRGRDLAAYRLLGNMPQVGLTVEPVSSSNEGADRVLWLKVMNPSPVAALNAHFGLLDQAGVRILPAYWNDNYIALLPGEQRTLIVHYPTNLSATKLKIDGWNVLRQIIAVPPPGNR